MIDKQDYYHGAAIVKVLEDGRCKAFQKKGTLGYVCNERAFLFVKYTTKARTPWQFAFDREDVDRAKKMASEHERVVCVFVCGGDGVCAVSWSEIQQLLSSAGGRITVARKHNKQYSVWGTVDELRHKIALNRWPEIVFEETAAPAVQPAAVGVE